MAIKAQSFDDEFKVKAIKLALSSSQPISKTVESLGVKPTTLYSWVKNKQNADIGVQGEEGKNLHDELARLRKENARLKEEREILKKAAAFFVKESQ